MPLALYQIVKDHSSENWRNSCELKESWMTSSSSNHKTAKGLSHLTRHLRVSNNIPSESFRQASGISFFKKNKGLLFDTNF